MTEEKTNNAASRVDGSDSLFWADRALNLPITRFICGALGLICGAGFVIVIVDAKTWPSTVVAFGGLILPLELLRVAFQGRSNYLARILSGDHFKLR